MYIEKSLAEYIEYKQVIHTKDQFIETHYHYNALGGYDYELVYVLRGNAVHINDGKRFEIGEGNYFFVDYGSIHTYEMGDCEEFEIINLIFDHRAVDIWYKKIESLSELAAFHGINPNLGDNSIRSDMLFSDSEDKMVKAAFLEIVKELHDRVPGYHEIVKCKLMEILLRGFRIYFNRENKLNCSPAVRFVIDYLATFYMYGTTLSELAERLHISTPYLSKKFKDEVGQNYIDYLHSRRITESCRILSTSTDSVESIAEYVGYSDSKRFREKFKEIMGISPREYRNSLLR